MSLPDKSVASFVLCASIRSGVTVKSLTWTPKGIFGKKEILLVTTEDGTVRLDPSTLGEMTVNELAARLKGE